MDKCLHLVAYRQGLDRSTAALSVPATQVSLAAWQDCAAYAANLRRCKLTKVDRYGRIATTVLVTR